MMNLKHSLMTAAITSALSINTAQALNYNPSILDMEYNGLFTLLDPVGTAFQNTGYPYYGDPTWGYGFRTQISGTMTLDTTTGYGTATISPFELFGASTVIDNFELQAIENNLLLGKFTFRWNGTTSSTQIVLDASGLFAELPTSPGDIYDATTCAVSGTCATPASDGIKNGKYPIGPVPISTSSFNVNGSTGLGTTLAQLSLGSDDGIGGSPMDNGPFSGYNLNIDFTSLQVSPIPVPAAMWLFGSGLIALTGIARRRKV